MLRVREQIEGPDWNMKTSPVFDEIRALGREEGREEGRQEGRQEGLEKGLEKGRQEGLTLLRGVLLTAVKARFPTLVTQARTQASRMKTPELLKDVIEKIMLATTQEEAEQALLNWRALQKKSQTEQ